MSLQKYGITNVYGYGFLRGPGPFAMSLNPNVLVVSKSRSYQKWIGKQISVGGEENQPVLFSESPTSSSKFSFSNNPFGGSLPSHKPGIFLSTKSNFRNERGRQQLFVVFNNEDGKWHEYFTGAEIRAVSSTIMEQTNMSIDEAAWGSILVVDADAGPYKVYNELCICDIKECDAVSFAEGVKSYSDSEIREMVRQINAMQQDAKKWGMAFEGAIRIVQNERNKIDKGMSNVKSDLESGFGKYATESNKTTQKSTQQSSTNKQETFIPREIQQLWIKMGKCAYCGGELKKNEIIQNLKRCQRCGKTFST